MPDLLAELRAALDFQRALGGRFVPRVDVPDDASAASANPPAVSAPPPAAPTPPPAGASAPSSDASAAHSSPIENGDNAWTESAPAPEPVAPSPVSSVLSDDDAPSDDAMSGPDLFGNAPPPAPEASGTPYARIEALVPDGHPVKAAATLAEAEAVAQTTVFIPLDETRLKTVFGTGNPRAGLLIVGEAPGADEDRTGEPFVGRAGQLLTKILAAVGFTRDDVYICNVLKSRPPGNRTPEPDEIAAHLPLLYKQIALVQPRVILCVGATAGNALLGKKASLGALRDREHSFHGLPLFVTYHPAALLRNEQWKRPTWEDVQLMKAAFDREQGEG